MKLVMVVLACISLQLHAWLSLGNTTIFCRISRYNCIGVQCECVYTQTIIKLIMLHHSLNRETETLPINHRTLFQQTPWMYYTRNKNRHTLDIIIHCVHHLINIVIHCITIIIHALPTYHKLNCHTLVPKNVRTLSKSYH